MEAKIVGIKDLDFDADNGKVQMRQYFITYQDKMETSLSGLMVGRVNWNILERGKAPDLKLGDNIHVQYTRNGRLAIV